MKLNPEVFERAAESLLNEWPGIGCCSRINVACDMLAVGRSRYQAFFRKILGGGDGGPYWWPTWSLRKDSLYPRIFALLLAAEVCRDELDPKRHKPAKKAGKKQDAWAKKTPHERLSDLVGAAEAARISKGRK